MTALEIQAFDKKVVHFYVNFSECNKSATVKHFVKEGAKRRTVYYIIKRYEQRGTANHLPKSGRPLATETTLKTRKVVKLLVNTAMDEKGNVSEPYIRSGTMKSDQYLNECLIKRLIPFIEKHHKISDVLFWPDMATIHYSKEVENWLNSMNIRFVSRIGNAPNVPIARPIERFWHLCKKSYSQRSCPPTSYRGLHKVWSNLSKEVAERCGQSLMKSVRQKLRLIGRQGVLAPYKH